jgi:L-asparaginase
VVLNDEINSARDVTKTDALRLQTFRSPTHGVLGIVDRDRVVFFRELLQRHSTKSEFDVTKLTALPRVDVVMVYQGATGDVIKALVDLGAKGIVIAGAGAGATSGTQNEGLEYAAEKGVFIVTSTRTGAGRIAPPNRGGQGGQGQGNPPSLTPAQQRRRAFSISAEDHIPVKARILLMLALATTTNRDEIQRIFSEY